MIDLTAADEISDDARARSNLARLAAAQALTGANSAVIFATGSIVGAALAPDMSLATVPLSMYVLGLAVGFGVRSNPRTQVALDLYGGWAFGPMHPLPARCPPAPSRAPMAGASLS